MENNITKEVIESKIAKVEKAIRDKKDAIETFTAFEQQIASKKSKALVELTELRGQTTILKELLSSFTQKENEPQKEL